MCLWISSIHQQSVILVGHWHQNGSTLWMDDSIANSINYWISTWPWGVCYPCEAYDWVLEGCMDPSMPTNMCSEACRVMISWHKSCIGFINLSCQRLLGWNSLCLGSNYRCFQCHAAKSWKLLCMHYASLNSFWTTQNFSLWWWDLHQPGNSIISYLFIYLLNSRTIKIQCQSVQLLNIMIAGEQVDLYTSPRAWWPWCACRNQLAGLDLIILSLAWHPMSWAVNTTGRCREGIVFNPDLSRSNSFYEHTRNLPDNLIIPDCTGLQPAHFVCLLSNAK